MGSIPLPALDIKPPEDPLTQYAKALSVQSMIQGQQTTKLQQTALEQENQQRDIALNDQKAMTAAMQQWDGKSYDDLIPLVVKNGGSSTAVVGLKSKLLEQQQTLSKIAENDANTKAKNLETLKGNNDLLLGHLDGVLGKDENGKPNVSDDDLVTRVNQEKNTALHGGYLDKDHADAIDRILATNNPDQIRGALGIFEKTLTGQKEQFANAKTQAETYKAIEEGKLAESQLGVTLPVPANIASGLGVPNLSGKMVTAKLLKEMKDAFDAGQHYENYGGMIHLVGPGGIELKTMGTAPATATFNLQQQALKGGALDMPAEMYYQTGEMPAGIRSPAMASAIITRAQQLHPDGAKDLAGNKAAYAANKESYENTTKTLDTLSGFEAAAVKNINMFKQLAGKLPDSGVPWLNTPLRNLDQNLVGAQWMPAINAARQIANREVARVTNDPKLSGVLSDSARAEVAAINPDNATMAQILHVTDVLKQDMANVHESLQKQKDDIGSRIGIKSPKAANTNEPPATTKTLTMAQIKKAAEDNNVSVEEATRQAKAAGYEVKQQ